MMYDNIAEMLKRTDLQRIREFILTGGDVLIDKSSYEERLQKSSEPILNRLKSIYPDELHDAFCEFNQAVGAYEYVCTEIGIKIGVRLMLNLLSC